MENTILLTQFEAIVLEKSFLSWQKITAGDLSGIKWIENFLQIMKSMCGGKEA